MPIEYNINKRWEDGIDHHPKSVALFKCIAKVDFKYCSDSFCWKSGGDGDNGETLMYILDIIFEEDDERHMSHITACDSDCCLFDIFHKNGEDYPICNHPKSGGKLDAFYGDIPEYCPLREEDLFLERIKW